MAFHKFEFSGFVEKVGEEDDYGREVILRDAKNPDEDKNPQFITFKLSSKNAGLFDGIGRDSEVKVEFYLNGIMGVSKKTNRPYNINKLNISKVEVVNLVKEEEPAEEDDGEEASEPENSDIPF